MCNDKLQKESHDYGTPFVFINIPFLSAMESKYFYSTNILRVIIILFVTTSIM